MSETTQLYTETEEFLDIDRFPEPQLREIGDVSVKAAGVEKTQPELEPTPVSAQEARQILKPPKGLEINIHSDSVAVETARQLTVFRLVISGIKSAGEVALHEDQETTDAQHIIEQLSDLSTLYVEDSDFDLLTNTLIQQGMTRDEASRVVTETKQAHMLNVAKILAHSIRSTDFIKHSGEVVEILVDGHIKPRGKLMKEGKYFARSGAFETKSRQIPQAILSEMRRQVLSSSYGDATHSLLFHGRQTTTVDQLSQQVYIPIQSILETTPILMPGQDARGHELAGSRLSGGDEAHGKDPIRKCYAEVSIQASDEFLATLPEIEERKMVEDITFMPENPTADTAYEYEFDVSGGIIVLNESETLAKRLQDMIPTSSEIRKVKRIEEQLSKGDITSLAIQLTKLHTIYENGDSQAFQSDISRRAWESMLRELEGVKSVFEERLTKEIIDNNYAEFIDINLAETAVLRFLMRQVPGMDFRRIDTVFILPAITNPENNLHKALLESLTQKLHIQSDSPTGDGLIISYKDVSLGFNQSAMATSVVEAYAAHHE